MQHLYFLKNDIIGMSKSGSYSFLIIQGSWVGRLDVLQDARQLFSFLILWFYDEDQGEEGLSNMRSIKGFGRPF